MSKSKLPVRGKDPALQSESPESVAQHLDMLESGPLRGDLIEHDHGRKPDSRDLQNNYNVDMAEENREGDDMSGDEHSSGLQGDEGGELESQPQTQTGLPGDENRLAENEVDDREKRRTG